MALVVDLDTSSKEVWKKNLAWPVTTMLKEKKKRTDLEPWI